MMMGASFDWPNVHAVWEKVQEEFGELGQAMIDEKPEKIAEELGDFLFSLVNLSRLFGFNAESLLRKGNEKFLRRFEKMEHCLTDSGIAIEDATLEQMDRVWDELKKEDE